MEQDFYEKKCDTQISIERLEDLFSNGSITAKEYSLLLHKLYPLEKTTSVFAWACLLTASLSWILVTKHTFGDDVYTLLSVEGKNIVATILPPLSIIFFFLAYKETRKRESIKGFEIATAGLALSIAMLVLLTIPFFIMKLYY